MIEYERKALQGVPDYRAAELLPKRSEYCLLIPVINEGARILTELGRAQTAGVDTLCDIVICDGAGRDYKCRLVQTLEHEAEAEVIEVVPCKAEPTVRSTVFAGLPKGERSDFLVQKCTEAGTAEIVFFSCTRCVAKAVNMEKKLERWQRIAEEAAKQSGRGIIPQVRYEADFVAVLNDALHTDLPLFMYETGERETIRDAIEHTASPIASAAIITGPEGGFAEFEADMARKLGMHICSMGERILRCETAPVVALTALMYGTGNL